MCGVTCGVGEGKGRREALKRSHRLQSQAMRFHLKPCDYGANPEMKTAENSENFWNSRVVRCDYWIFKTSCFSKGCSLKFTRPLVTRPFAVTPLPLCFSAPRLALR